VCLSHVFVTLEDPHTSTAFADAGATADISTRATNQRILVARDSAIDRVVEGLRILEGREHKSLCYVSKGYASPEFARLVKEVVKTMLKVERTGLVRARLFGSVAHRATPQDAVNRFVENAATTIETALGLTYSTVETEWRPVATVKTTGGENYAHANEKLAKRLNVRRKDKVYCLRYDVGNVEYGGAKASGVVVLVFLGGEKMVRVEVLAKSVASVSQQFKKVEWDGGKWVRLATAWIHKPSGVDYYMTRVEPRLAGLEAEVRTGRVLSFNSLASLTLTDAGGGFMINTPDPLLLTLFSMHFERVKLKDMGVTHTKAGLTLQFKAITLDDKPFKELLGDIAEKYGVRLWELLRKAKGFTMDAIAKLSKDIDRVVEEAARAGREGGVGAGRRALFEGLERLFEEKEREALEVGGQVEALALAVAGRLLLKAVESPMGWLSLLVGDGVVDVARKRLGFSAKPAEVAVAMLRLLATWAGAYGAKTRVRKGMAEYTRAEDVEKVLKAVLTGETLEFAQSLARSWNGLAGSHAPKLVSLLALAQLLGVVEGKWVVELWLAHKAATTSMSPKVATALEKTLDRVEEVVKVKWMERSAEVYFKWRNSAIEGATHVAVLRLRTDFAHFRLYCDPHNESSSKSVLEAVTSELDEKVKQHRNALNLPADVGWLLFLKLWLRYNMSIRIEEGGRELLRVEVLETRPDSPTKFRLWYHKWHETRPHKPYVDFEIKPYQDRRGGILLFGRVYANEAEGIFKQHLTEIAEVFKREGARGISIEGGRNLKFSGAFNDYILGRLGVVPELPEVEPITVEHLDGFRFRIGDREIVFNRGYVKGGYEFYAELRPPPEKGAVRYTASLRRAGIYAKALGNVVRLNSDSFFGLLAATNAALPGLTPLYRSEDLHVYASVEEGGVRYYFAVKHNGVWRVTEGVYDERSDQLRLYRAEADILEAIRDAMEKALMKLGHPIKVGEPKEERDKEGHVKAYYLRLYGHHLTPFLGYATKSAKAKPADLAAEGSRIVIKAGGIEATVEFKPLKGKEAVYLLAADVRQTLALYKSLKALGVPIKLMPRGIKIEAEAMWSLLAAVVEKAIEKGAVKLVQGSDGHIKPAEVSPGIELLNVYCAGDMCMYAFRAFEKGVHYYFAVKMGEGWRAAGGKYSERRVEITGKAACAIADAINAIYRERGVERRVEVKQKKSGMHYIKLAKIDLKLLGLA